MYGEKNMRTICVTIKAPLGVRGGGGGDWFRFQSNLSHVAIHYLQNVIVEFFFV